MQRVASRKIEWVWLGGLLLLVALHHWFPRIGRGPRRDSYSTRAEGKKAFFLLVRQRGYTTDRNREPIETMLDSLGRTDTLLLLGPARYPTDPEWDRLLDWVAEGGSLLIAARGGDGANLDLDIPRLDVSVQPTELVQTDRVQTTLVGNDRMIWRSRGTISPDGVAADEKLIECDGQLQAAGRAYGNGYVVVVASDFVFSNQSLAWKDHSGAELAFRLLEAAGPSERVVFDERLNASGTPKVVGLALEPFLRPVTIQLLIVLLLFGWWQSRRFGPLLPQSASKRQNIVDHTDTLGTLYFKSSNRALPLRAYLSQLERELRLTTSGGHEERALDAVAARMQVSADSLRKLFEDARRAARSVNLDRRTAAGMIRRLALVRRAAVHPRKAYGEQQRTEE